MAKRKRKSSSKKKKLGVFQTAAWTVGGLIVLALAYRLLTGPGLDEAPSVDTELNEVSLQDMLQSTDPAECLTYLNEKKAELNGASVTINSATAIQNERYEVAGHLYEIAVTEQEEVQAIVHQLEAARGLVALQYANPKFVDSATARMLGHDDRLKTLALKFEKYPNDKIQLQVHSGLLLLAVHAYTNHLVDRAADQGKTDSLRRTATTRFLDTFEKYHDDLRMLKPMQVVFQHWLRTESSSANALCDQVVAKVKAMGNDNKMADDFAQDLLDFTILEKHNYQRLIKDRLNETSSNQALLKASLEILKTPNFGPRVAKQLATTAAWYEARNELDAARQLFAAIAKTAPQLHYEAASTGLMQVGADGLARIATLGKKLEIEATSTKGVKISNDTLANRVVVCVFWTGNDDQTFDLLKSFYSQKDEFRSRRIEVLPIHISKELSIEAEQLVGGLTDWNFVSANLAEMRPKFPINSLPHILILNHEHEVARVRANLVDMKNVLERLETERRKAMTPSSPEVTE